MKILGIPFYYKNMFFVVLILSFWQISGQELACVELTVPVEGSVDVPLDTPISWVASFGATGYRITIGSSTGENDILDDFDVGNITSYQLPDGFPVLISVFMTITPYNNLGSNMTCTELRFTTTSEMTPRCTQIINPSDGDMLVPVNANITWIRDFTATGYLMSIRKKNEDGAFILREENVGNGTNYKPPNFEPRTKYFVTMIPYNAQGNAMECEPIEFTTGDPLPLPDCAAWVSPTNGEVDINPTSILEWEPVAKADGYILTLGTSLNGTDLLNQEDVGNNTSYSLDENFPIGTTVYAKINTYEGDDISENCPIISFKIKGPDPLDFTGNVPQFFTPNNDGFNDTWKIPSKDPIIVLQISVYNRFGQLIKQLAPNQSWDGTFNGRELPSDSYWYTIVFSNAPKVRGYFLLKR